MVVYVNDRNEICAVESTDNVNLTPLTINDEEIHSLIGVLLRFVVIK